MTIKEIIDGLKFTVDMCELDVCDGSKIPRELLNKDTLVTINACEGAIELLKQEPMSDVLNKIKEEIFLLSDTKCDGYSITICSWTYMQRKILDIIDSYIAERK